MTRAELLTLHSAIATILSWPPAVLDEVRRWLTPEDARLPDARRGNGIDHHPPPSATGRDGEIKPRRPGGKLPGVNRAPAVNLPAFDPGQAKTPTPSAKDRRRGSQASIERLAEQNRAKARAVEDRLMAAMRDNPGRTVLSLAAAAQASRSATGDRLRQLARRGLVEKDAAGRWRLAGEGRPRPYASAVDLTAGKEGPAAAGDPWVKPLSHYERKESTFSDGCRYW